MNIWLSISLCHENANFFKRIQQLKTDLAVLSLNVFVEKIFIRRAMFLVVGLKLSQSMLGTGQLTTSSICFVCNGINSLPALTKEKQIRSQKFRADLL